MIAMGGVEVEDVGPDRDRLVLKLGEAIVAAFGQRPWFRDLTDFPKLVPAAATFHPDTAPRRWKIARLLILDEPSSAMPKVRPVFPSPRLHTMLEPETEIPCRRKCTNEFLCAHRRTQLPASKTNPSARPLPQRHQRFPPGTDQSEPQPEAAERTRRPALHHAKCTNEFLSTGQNEPKPPTTTTASTRPNEPEPPPQPNTSDQTNPETQPISRLAISALALAALGLRSPRGTCPTIPTIATRSLPLRQRRLHHRRLAMA